MQVSETGRLVARCAAMKLTALAFLLSLAAMGEPDKKQEDPQKSLKAGAKQVQSDVDRTVEKGRKKGRKAAKQVEKEANDAARALRQKLGTEK